MTRKLQEGVKERAEKLDASASWTFYGTGSMGDKAKQLYEKRNIIEAAGFTINPRVVLRTGWTMISRSATGFQRPSRRGQTPAK
ncbi:TPA: hypothetical protein EYP38_03345 [Candidatus Micrarchaeota archaeon]|nr:hypothetical protein [Candidatus Micrarchaeota archaeon]